VTQTANDIIAQLFADLAETEEPAEPDQPHARAHARRDAISAALDDRDRTARLRNDLAALAAVDPDRLEWPDWWFEPVTSIVHRQIRRLWTTVLVHVALDAASTSPHSKRQHSDAMAWLNGHRRDRAFVCGLADRDPDEFSRAVLAWIEKGAPSNARRHRPVFGKGPHDPSAEPAPGCAG